jgi:uncharacterized membrane protein YhaH (DUF805 family)
MVDAQRPGGELASRPLATGAGHPAAAPAASTSGWTWLLFSFQGRATRGDYWLRFFLLYVALNFMALVIDAAAGTLDSDSGVGVFSTLLGLAAVWPSFAVSAKRLHDRDKSGWYILLGFIPIIGWIWMFVELGCLRGTVGHNRFGPDPFEGKS